MVQVLVLDLGSSYVDVCFVIDSSLNCHFYTGQFSMCVIFQNKISFFKPRLGHINGDMISKIK